MSNPTTTLTKPVQNAVANKSDIRSFIASDDMRRQMALALPKHITPDRMIRVCLTACLRTPKLLQCTRESLASCLMTCSQFGLEPDGRLAHLIPFENRKQGTVECTLIIDWKGLAALAMRSGVIAKLHADLICEEDEFDFDKGEILRHKINFRAPRGEPYAAYALATTKTGETFVQVMQKWEIEAVRDNSQGYKAFKAGYTKSSPWVDATGEMWKKTPFRRLCKWLPLSPEFRDAIDLDDKTDGIVSDVAISAATLKPFFAAPALPESAPDNQQPEPSDDIPMGESNQPQQQPQRGQFEQASASTPQGQLEDIVTANGYTFNDLIKFGIESGNIKNADSIPDFASIPTDDAKRLVKAKTGLLQQLKNQRAATPTA